jgi:hypothetical protein
MGRTADLCEQLQVDLHAMRTFAGLDAAKYGLALQQFTEHTEKTLYFFFSRFMTVAAQLEPEVGQESPSTGYE